MQLDSYELLVSSCMGSFFSSLSLSCNFEKKKSFCLTKPKKKKKRETRVVMILKINKYYVLMNLVVHL